MAFEFKVAGIMSGTSLDGLDIALCRFIEQQSKWSFEVIGTSTIPYSGEWKKRLSEAIKSDGATLAQLHFDFGHYIGACVREFSDAIGEEPDLVSSHGHTVFHQPEKGLTFQLGSGAAIAASTGLDTVCDLRSTDVALGGQGAPLVPIGDLHLFGGHRFCLNLGGIANISFDEKEHRVAFDICPANMALNYLAELTGLAYDEGGELAMRGEIIPELLQQLNQLQFYHQKPPKSLGWEWFQQNFLPLISTTNFSVEDRMRTVIEHIEFKYQTVFSFSGNNHAHHRRRSL
ncbi:MAG: anhydro-N-acetylmuramic acid kinase [Bacteroidetes bacterium]|nr:anhydro-N-acetylmuramic acid kinase [Bacteroidota bacterium]